MKKHKNPTQSNFKGPGPVQKIEFLAKVASLAQLSRADLAVLITVTDMINSRTGDAWPSYKTLASRSGCSDRHAKSTVNGLIQKKLLRIVIKGNRIRSNRYAINLAAPIINTNFCSDLSHTSVVMPDRTCCEEQLHEEVSYTSHKPIHEPEHQARDEMNGSPDGDASPTGASGPSGSHQPGTDRYPDFWEVYPLRARVAEAEQQIAEWIEDGVDYLAIIDGAQRYKEYCSATGGFKRSDAFNWLTHQRWRDGWDLPKKKVKNKSPDNSMPLSQKIAISYQKNQDKYAIEWDRINDQIWKLMEQTELELSNHIGEFKGTGCDQCFEFSNKNRGSHCPTGLALHEANERALDTEEDFLKNNPRPKD